MRSLRKAFCLAEKMEEGLGQGVVLQRQMSKK